MSQSCAGSEACQVIAQGESCQPKISLLLDALDARPQVPLTLAQAQSEAPGFQEDVNMRAASRIGVVRIAQCLARLDRLDESSKSLSISINWAYWRLSEQYMTYVGVSISRAKLWLLYTARPGPSAVAVG